MANGRPVTNDKIYDLINSTRLELKNDIVQSHAQLSTAQDDLRRQFETLEAGRLTRLEGRMNDFVLTQANKDNTIKTTQAVMSTKFLVVWSLGGALVVAFLTALAYKIVGR